MIKKIIEVYRRRKAIIRIRQHFSAFGCDLDSMSDQDIENRLIPLSKMIRDAGITQKEVMIVMSKINASPAPETAPGTQSSDRP